MVTANQFSPTLDNWFNLMAQQVFPPEIDVSDARVPTNEMFSELYTHADAATNPHGVTKSQVGLGNVDNTSDAAKPISTATQAAFNILTSLLASDQTDLDTLQEIVDYIQTNREDLDALGISGITGLQSALDAKQGTLVSSTNIKTINGSTLLGSGDLSISAKLPIVTEATTARTLGLTDSQKYLRCTNASATTITIPPQSSVAWTADTEIVIEQSGTGQVTVAPGAGVTIRTSRTLKSNLQYSQVTLKRVASDEWVCGGDRSAS